MNRLPYLIVLLQIIFQVTETLDPRIRHEAFLDPIALLNFYNYPGEAHNVTTNDSYILTLHRIPSEIPNAIPILMIHGLSCASTMYFMTGYESPAFILSNAKYDVWIANLRGSPYTSHIKYTQEDNKFWDFSFDEMGEHDVTSMIDFVLKATNRSKLILIGESIGSIASFAMFATKPSYNNKVAHLFALTPITRGNYAISTPMNLLLKLSRFLSIISPYHLPFFPSQLLTLIMEIVSYPQFSFLADIVLGLAGGYNPYFYNRTRLPMYVAHCGHGSSLKLFLHLSRLQNAIERRKFDYGKKENLEKYNSLEPPIYEAKNVIVPITIFQAANDFLADPLDMELLSLELPNIKNRELLPFPLTSHIDVVIASNLRELVFDKLLIYLQDVIDSFNYCNVITF